MIESRADAGLVTWHPALAADFFALDGDEVIGTCAMVPHCPDEFELAKLAVTPAAQGRGIGHRLVEADVFMVLELS